MTSSRISPTAFYTGHVWCKNDLSHPALDTRTGAFLFGALRPLAQLNQALFGSLTLEQMLLSRHLLIDFLLAKAIESGQVNQVVEIAGGLSGRGLRISERYKDRGLLYIEGDLPGMAERKRRILEREGLLNERHQVVALDALLECGALSMQAEVGPKLIKNQGTAVIIEGLLSYLPRAGMERVLLNVRRLIEATSGGVFLSDIYLSEHVNRVAGGLLFRRLLEIFVRGQTYLHFQTESEAEAAFGAHGFERTRIHDPREHALKMGLWDSSKSGPTPVHIAEAWVQSHPSG